MKKLEDIGKYEYVYVEPEDGSYDMFFTKEEFIDSHYYKDRDEKIKLFTTKEVCAKFSLYDAIEYLEDDMYEGWLDDVMNSFTEDVVDHIESEINSHLKDTPTYYPCEEIEW